VFAGVSNNVRIDPETIVALSYHSNIVGCKISHGDVAHHALVGLHEDIYYGENNFNLFTGLGQILLPVMSVGGKGTVDVLCGAFQQIYVDLFNAIQAGDLYKARELQKTCTRGEETVSKFSVVGIKKCIYLQGFGETYLARAPLNQDLAPGAWESLEHYFKEIQTVDISTQ
jgi:2-keto-3-deoxy-L-rhamnonate aldolase